MTTISFGKELCSAIVSAIPADGFAESDNISLKYAYFPSTHSRALQLTSPLIEGIRGSGKTFWHRLLQDPDGLKFAAEAMPQSGLTSKTIVTSGFGADPTGNYPNRDAIQRLIDLSLDTRIIWKTIVLRAALEHAKISAPVPTSGWDSSARWVATHPEAVQSLFIEISNTLSQHETPLLILFDALDRTASSWTRMNLLMRGLLELLLEFKNLPMIHLKAFVRPDHLASRDATSFVDASKLLNYKIELRWPRQELYSLFWQHLANEDCYGEKFRITASSFLASSGALHVWGDQSNIFTLPRSLQNSPEFQRGLFHMMTGPYMGKDQRRGYPYTWLISHLGDSSEQVSPRSFLQALREASADSQDRNSEFPIHYESIKQGVKKASQIRVQEMAEDYGWVNVCMDPLRGLSVPCDLQDITSRWSAAQTISKLENHSTSDLKLAPAQIANGESGLCDELVKLRVFERTRGGKINLPDVYRVGYGIGRRGGVKPAALS